MRGWRRHSLLVRIRDDDLPADAERRQVIFAAPEGGPFRPVGVGQRPYPVGGDEREHRHAQPRAPARPVERHRRVPEGQRLLHRVGHHGCRLELVVLPVEVHDIGGQAKAEDLEGLVEPPLRLVARHSAVVASIGEMPRPTPRTSLPPVSWSRVVVSSIIRIGGISGRIEISVPSLFCRGALGRCGQQQVRGGDAERGAVMLGELVGVVAEPLIGLDQRQALGQLRSRRPSGSAVVIENGEAHRQPSQVVMLRARRSHAYVRDHFCSLASGG